MRSVTSIIILLLLSLSSTQLMASQFCDGYRAGYISGYKQAKGTSLKPATPLCPAKPLKGSSDPKSDFEFGYAVGFQKGTEKGSR